MCTEIILNNNPFHKVQVVFADFNRCRWNNELLYECQGVSPDILSQLIISQDSS